jgi:hypothetical protein
MRLYHWLYILALGMGLLVVLPCGTYLRYYVEVPAPEVVTMNRVWWAAVAQCPGCYWAQLLGAILFFVFLFLAMRTERRLDKSG